LTIAIISNTRSSLPVAVKINMNPDEMNNGAQTDGTTAPVDETTDEGQVTEEGSAPEAEASETDSSAE
jgi:hypothetical protein